LPEEITMSLKVQGTTLFFIDPADDSVVEVGCITSFNGLTASRDQTDVTCLQDEARKFEAGLLNPGAASFGIYFDPADASHIRLHALYAAGTKLEWALAASDGIGIDPTGVDTDGQFILPTTRTFWTFNGYLSDYPFDFAVGARVNSAIAIQLSDFPTLHPKTP
jgi:hypothetical protein